MNLRSLILCALLASGVALTPVQAVESKTEITQTSDYVKSNLWGYLAGFLFFVASGTSLFSAFRIYRTIVPPMNTEAKIRENRSAVPAISGVILGAASEAYGTVGG